NRGLLLAAKGNTAEAAAQFRRAAELDGHLAAAHYQLGGILAADGHRSKAIEEYEICIEDDPSHANARAELAVLLLEIGDSAAAAEQLEAAHKSKPADVRILNKLAWVLATSSSDDVRDPPRAKALADQLVALTGDRNPQALDTLAAAQAAMGEFDDAVATVSRAATLARAKRNRALANAIELRMSGYRQRHAYREVATSKVEPVR